MILSGAMLLRHIGERAAAENVERAVDEVLGGAGSHPRPGRVLDHEQVAEAIAAALAG